MRHKVKKVKLGTDTSHTKAILRNLAMSLIIHEKIKTTPKRAKAVQSFVEKLITLAKTKDKMNAIRLVTARLDHVDSSKKLFEVIVDRYKDRDSGYTRITKLGNRNGDNAPIVQIELV